MISIRTPGAALAATLLLLVPSLAAAIDCPVPSLPRPTESYAATRARLQSAGDWHPMADPSRTPPADPQVGDTWLWYVWNLGGFPVATLKPATVRGMGDHCYVVVDDDEWLVSMDQEDVDRIVEHFENVSLGQFADQGIWNLNTSHFGDPPNPLDGLDRVFLFYYRFNIPSDGYFWSFDQFPDGTQDFASNECDVVYLATDSSGGGPGSDYMLAVAAHEFQHLIHFARDEDEDLWVEEGLGELAMWLFGHPDTISGFNNNPDNSLVAWGSQWADYIQTYLWTLYCYERYGGQPLIWNLCHNPTNGMSGYQQTLNGMGHSVLTLDVFDDWSVANYIDDTTVPDGRYGYQGEALPPFFPWRTHTTLPASGSGSVLAYATDYIRLQNLTGIPTVSFDGFDIRPFRVTLIARDAAQPTMVAHVPLDGLQNGSLAFVAADSYDEVVISVSNVHAASAGTYSYSVTLGAVDVPDVAVAAPALAAYPNPFNPRTEVRFTLPSAGHVRLRVYRPDGRLVRELADASFGEGAHAVAWSGDDAAGRAMPSGTYLMRLETPAGAVVQKTMLVR